MSDEPKHKDLSILGKMSKLIKQYENQEKKLEGNPESKSTIRQMDQILKKLNKLKG